MYGLCGTTHLLLKSYLSNRLEYSSELDETSNTLPVTYGHGVPQGSVLRPFLLYFLFILINNLSNCCEKGIFVLFADDTSIFFCIYFSYAIVSIL